MKMAGRVRDKQFLARLVTGETERAPCAFCLRKVDDEITFGKLYAIGDIQCHYFCCLLSCCLIQKGHDDEGLFGFMYTDILAELERSKKHRCSYCSRNGATLGCSVGSCRKQFHLPCGRERDAVSLYYGNYKSFCQQHAPRQKVPDHIMAKAKLRMRVYKQKCIVKRPENAACLDNDVQINEEEMVCVICYEAVDGYPTRNTFWPPCCAKDAWFHRSCVQRMALSAGMHYLKCPLCNDKENFYEAVVGQGYYVPDRDAAWELEQNAFAEIYERSVSCGSEDCICPLGRDHDSENGPWDIKLCLLCGSAGVHAQCLIDQSKNSIDPSQNPINTPDSHSDIIRDPINSPYNPISPPQDPINPPYNPINPPQDPINPPHNPINIPQEAIRSQKWAEWSTKYFVCKCCMPAAPEDLDSLASNIEAIIQREQAISAANTRRPVMPSRMSLRRTKGRLLNSLPSSSTAHSSIQIDVESSVSQNIQASRQELNLKTPKRASYQEPNITRRDDNKPMSPFKLLEQSFKEKVVCTGVRDAVLDESVIEMLRKKFRKPRPLSEKKKIVNDILDGLFDDLMKNESKQRDHIREWCSPKKCFGKDEFIGSCEHSHSDQIQDDKLNENETSKDTKNQSLIDINKESKSNASETFKDDSILKSVMNSENAQNPHEIIVYDAMSDTPKRKTIDILQDSSLEISGNDQSITIDVIKMDESTQKDAYKKLKITLPDDIGTCAFKFSKLDKYLESFKQEYLNEVDRKFKCSYNHKHMNKTQPSIKLRTVIDFAIDAYAKIENNAVKNKDQIKNEREPINNEEEPINNKEEPINNEQEPVNNEQEPINNEPKPIKNEREPINNEEEPVNCEQEPVNNEQELIKNEQEPINNEPKPIKNEREPINNEEEPINCEQEPVNSEKELIKNEQEPINNEPKPIKNELESINNDREPMKNKEKMINDGQEAILIKKASKEKCQKVTKNKPEMINKKRNTRKRKLSASPIRLVFNDNDKKRKMSDDLMLNSESTENSTPIVSESNKEVKRRRPEKERKRKSKKKKSSKHKDIEVCIDSSEKRMNKKKTIKKKIRTQFAIKHADIKVKIKWKKKQLSLNIKSKEQARKKKEKLPNFKQYLLQFPEGSKEVLVKPEKEVNILKKKYKKQEKSPDKFKQLSLDSFFKMKSP